MGSIVMCEHGTLEGMYCDDCEAELIPIRRRREAERAVIEAAKAARHASSTGGRHMGIIILFDKVDALLAAERGE